MNRLQKIKLKYIVKYGNPQKYWDKRWEYNDEKTSLQTYESRIREVMRKTQSTSILDVGCGPALLRNLQGYLGLDFSIIALDKSDLTEYLYADFTRHIPLPDKSFDCTLCANVLLHVPPSQIDKAISEICRVTEKAVILIETYKFQQNQPHCFSHNLPQPFREMFDGDLYVLC